MERGGRSVRGIGCRSLVGFDFAFKIVRGLVAVVAGSVTLFGGRGAIALHADAGERSFGGLQGSARDGGSTSTVLLLRAGFPRAPSVKVLRSDVFDSDGAAVVGVGISCVGGYCVANGGPVVFRAPVHSRRRRHAVGVLIVEVTYVRDGGRAMDNGTMRQGLRQQRGRRIM